MHKALFLDRDGVINIDTGYVHKEEDFFFNDNIFELCRIAQEKSYKIIIVTNQAGIAKGFFTEKDYFKLTEWMLKQFKINQVIITDIFFCPFHKDGLPPYNTDSKNRKPNTGMITEASKKYDIDLSKSIIIGDKESDIQAGKNAKLLKTILLFNKKYTSNTDDTHADNIIYNLKEAIELLP